LSEATGWRATRQLAQTMRELLDWWRRKARE
jgi:nucleoside-diphosphate-sugar epimerase